MNHRRALTWRTFSLENMFHFLPTRAWMNAKRARHEMKLTKA
jgi:hypothetical protein